jgi:hypothetical protein
VRRILELIGARIFRSRYGVAFLLVLIVVGIVGSAKLIGTPAGQNTGVLPRAPEPAYTTTVNPTAGDDGVVSSKPPPSPVTSPGTARPIAVARAFTLAWLHHRGVTAEQWRAGLLPHSTQALTGRLADTDPGGVPADRITGDPELIPRGEAFVEVAVPVDSGRLLLRLIAPEGRWLVDGVDWERS